MSGYGHGCMNMCITTPGVCFDHFFASSSSIMTRIATIATSSSLYVCVKRYTHTHTHSCAHLNGGNLRVSLVLASSSSIITRITPLCSDRTTFCQATRKKNSNFYYHDVRIVRNPLSVEHAALFSPPQAIFAKIELYIYGLRN
jgi:hypothetical protein